MIESADPATIYKARVVAHSRKHRRCDECNRDIEVGETYHSATMLYDGFWSTYATCHHCIAAQAWLIGQCGGFLHEGVLEDLREHVDELDFMEPGSRVRLLRLIVGVRRGWRSFTDPARLMAVRA